MTAIINLTPHPITITGQGYTDEDYARFADGALPVVYARSMPGMIRFTLAPNTTIADVEVALCGRLGTGVWEFGEILGDCYARRAGSITIPPSGKMARARESVGRATPIVVAPWGADDLTDTRHTVPVTTVSYDGTIDLPDPAPETVYVVSVITAQAAYLHGRAYADLLVPGEQIRDAQGRVTGCASLQRWRPQLGSRRQYLDALAVQAGSAAMDGSGYWPDIRKLVAPKTLDRAVRAFEMLLAGLADPAFFRGDLEQAIPLLTEIVSEALSSRRAEES